MIQSMHGDNSVEKAPTTLAKLNNTYNWCDYPKNGLPTIMKNAKEKNASSRGQNNESPRQPSPRLPFAAAEPQQSAADAAPESFSYAAKF